MQRLSGKKRDREKTGRGLSKPMGEGRQGENIFHDKLASSN